MTAYGLCVGLCAASHDSYMPFVPIPGNEKSAKFAAETAFDLCVVVALKTKERNICYDIVARVFVDVMKLQRLASLATNATRVVGDEHHLSGEVHRDHRASLCHRGLWALTFEMSARHR